MAATCSLGGYFVFNYNTVSTTDIIYLCCLFCGGIENSEGIMQYKVKDTMILYAAHQILLVLLKSGIIHAFKINVCFI